jgi:antitoxin component of MazEF toxin-antitoxin module
MKGTPFNRIRSVIRIGSSFYVSIPRRTLAGLNLYRGSKVSLEVKGKDIIFHSEIKDSWGTK